MARIFLALAVLDFLVLFVTFAVGVGSKLSGGLFDLDSPIYLIHYNLGLFTALTTLFVHCLVIVYLLGTGRMIKEICLAYGFPDDTWPRRTRDLKRGTTPFGITAMLVTIAAAAAGEARQHQVWPWWVHLVLAVATLLVNGWVFSRQYRNIVVNGRILDEVFLEVDRVRAERGLPSNAEILRQEEGGK